jgi:hypothetical protein
MRIYTGEELQTIIESIPDFPENAIALQQLWAMKQENDVIRQPYTFEVDFSTGAGLLAGAFAAPAPGAQTVGNFLVDTSSPFMLVSQSFKSDLAGVAQLSGTLVVPNQTVLIQDQSSNRNWSNVGVPLASYFGTGELPYFLPQPRFIPANTNVQVTLANFEAATTPNTRLSFHGYRLYSTKS